MLHVSLTILLYYLVVKVALVKINMAPYFRRNCPTLILFITLANENKTCQTLGKKHGTKTQATTLEVKCNYTRCKKCKTIEKKSDVVTVFEPVSDSFCSHWVLPDSRQELPNLISCDALMMARGIWCSKGHKA